MPPTLDAVPLAISPSPSYSPAGRPSALSGSLAGHTAHLKSLSHAELPPAVKAQLYKIGAHRPLAALPPGTLTPAGFAALPPLLWSMLFLHCGYQAECVIAGRSVGQCPIVPVAGLPDRAWALLPEGRILQLKRIPSDHAQGSVYIDEARQRGGSGIELDETPWLSWTVQVEKTTLDDDDMATGHSMTLELPSGLLEDAIDFWCSLHSNEAFKLVPQDWYGHVEAAVNGLSGFTWERTNHGSIYEANLKPSADSPLTYAVLLHFKDDGKRTDLSSIPRTGRVYFLSLTVKEGGHLVNGTPPKLVLDEGAWLTSVLERGGVNVPSSAKLWQLPESGKPVYLDMEMPPKHWNGTITREDVLEEDMSVEEDVLEAVLGKLSSFDMSHLEKQAFDALTEGGAYRHQLIDEEINCWGYQFEWKDVAFDVQYELDESGHSVSGLRIYYGKAALVVRCKSDESEAGSQYSDMEIDDDLPDNEEWEALIGGLETLDAAGREEMIAYYQARDREGLHGLDPKDPYLEQPVKFLKWLQSDQGLSAEALKEKTYDQRRDLAKAYLKANFKQQEATGARGALAPFMVALKPEDGLNEPADDAVWQKRIFQFDHLNDAHKKAAMRYYREMHAAKVADGTLRREFGDILPFLKKLQEQDSTLDAFLKETPEIREKTIENFNKNNRAKFPITRFIQQAGDIVSVRSTQKLPKGEPHLRDLDDFIHWRHQDENDRTVLTRGTPGYAEKSSFANWLCHLESKGKQARKLVRDSDPQILEKKWKISVNVVTVRTYRLWVHMQDHLETSYPDASGDRKRAEQRLTDWMFWRKDNIHQQRPGQNAAQEGKGPWQLLEQLPGMTDDDWNAQVNDYLTGRNIASDQQANARAPLDSFRNWVRTRRSGEATAQ